MARVYGVQGNVTGKIANTVYAIVKGVNIARAYNPEPANPQTPKQIESRAKLKVLSQMAKQLAPLIAFRPVGLVSARNLFAKANYDNVAFESDVASIEMESVDLTGGLVDLGQLQYDLSDNSVTAFVSGAAAGVKLVVFGVTAITGQGAIHVFTPQIVQESTTTPGRFDMQNVDVTAYDNISIFAYGIRFNSEAEFAKYEQLLVSAAGTGSINVIRSLNNATTTLTKTVHGTLSNAKYSKSRKECSKSRVS